MPEERKPQTEDKYIVRFPDGMRDRLKDAAKGNNRTMNAEIVARLESSFNDRLSQDLTFKMLNSEVARLTQELQMARTASIPFAAKIMHTVEEQVSHVMESRGLSFEDALLLLTTRGMSMNEAAPVAVIQIAKGTTLSEARALLRVISENSPQDAYVSYEPVEGIESTRLLTSEADKQAFLAAAKQSKT